MKFGRNVVKKKQHKSYQDEDKKSAINKIKKKKISSQIKKPHLKIILIKDKLESVLENESQNYLRLYDTNSSINPSQKT